MSNRWVLDYCSWCHKWHFQNNNLLSNFLIITKTTESGQVELADIMSARLLVDNEKLAQAVHEVPERLKVYAEAWCRHSDTLNINSECGMSCFVGIIGTHVIFIQW